MRQSNGRRDIAFVQAQPISQVGFRNHPITDPHSTPVVGPPSYEVSVEPPPPYEVANAIKLPKPPKPFKPKTLPKPPSSLVDNVTAVQRNVPIQRPSSIASSFSENNIRGAFAAASVANSISNRRIPSASSVQATANLISFSPERETPPQPNLPRSSSALGLLSVPKSGSKTSQNNVSNFASNIGSSSIPSLTSESASNITNETNALKNLRIIGNFPSSNINKQKADIEINRARLSENNPFELVGISEAATNIAKNAPKIKFPVSFDDDTSAINNNLSPPAREINNDVSPKLKTKGPPRPPPPKVASKTNTPKVQSRTVPTNDLFNSVMTEPHGLAIHDYQAKKLDELSIKKKDIILLERSIDSYWIYGKNGDKEGIFPVNYVNVIARPSYFLEPTEEYCCGRYSFEGENSTELSFKQGDKIKIIDKINDEWLIGKLKDSTGIFPLSFVEFQSVNLDNLKNDSKQNLIKKDIRLAIAEYDYQSDAPEDLQFKKGEIINIIEFIDDNWMKGKSSTGSTGIFPSNFVHFLQTEKVATATYDYESNVEGDLNFKKGETIIILEEINDEWVKGQINHKKGICPKNFLKF